MSYHCTHTDPGKIAAARDGGRRFFVAGLAVIVLIPAAEVSAADHGTDTARRPLPNDVVPPIFVAGQPVELRWQGAGSLAPVHANPSASAIAASRYGVWDLAPSASSLREPPSLAEAEAFSSSEFRPRPHGMLASNAAAGRSGDNLDFDKTVWQRLYEYRSRDRVRVVTLWESAASAVSIQANRKGGPSLQWTSRWMNRGGATRGLLDHWLPESVRGLTHSSSSPPPARSPNLLLLAPHPGFNPTTP